MPEAVDAMRSRNWEYGTKKEEGIRKEEEDSMKI